jgi:hypothetical protein
MIPDGTFPVLIQSKWEKNFQGGKSNMEFTDKNERITCGSKYEK